MSVFLTVHVFLKSIIFGKQKVVVVFHDKIIVGLRLHSLVFGVTPVIEAFNKDCSLPKGNVCHNFVVIILKISNVLKILK